MNATHRTSIYPILEQTRDNQLLGERSSMGQESREISSHVVNKAKFSPVSITCVNSNTIRSTSRTFDLLDRVAPGTHGEEGLAR
jgi:hypothetical protein